MLQNRLHLQQVVQSSVPILSVFAFSVLGPVKHTHTVCVSKIKINKLQTPFAMVTSDGEYWSVLWTGSVYNTHVG